MATIRLCDWSKERINKDDPIFKVIIELDGKMLEYEINSKSRKMLLDQLNSVDTPSETQAVDKPPVVGQKLGLTPLALEADAAPGIDIESDDPFGAEQAPFSGNGDDLSMPIGDDLSTPIGNDVVSPNTSDVPPLELPDSTHQRLKPATQAQANKVIEESTKFEEGSLPALSVGAKAQKAAMRKLREIEEKHDSNLKRKTQEGVNVNTGITDKPGYYRD